MAATSITRCQSLIKSCKMCIRYNSNRASICRIQRKFYQRQYPTVMVLPNGATINIRFPEPRRIIQLPIDFDKLSKEEQTALRQRRKPKTEIKIVKEIEDNYDKRKYLRFHKK